MATAQSGAAGSLAALSDQVGPARHDRTLSTRRGAEGVAGHAGRPIALMILCGGGFTFETKCLLNAIKGHVDFVYLKTEFGGTLGAGGIPDAESHAVPAFAPLRRNSVRQNVIAFVGTFARVAKLLRRNRIDLVVCVGCSHAVPMLLAGRLFRRKTTFVESITRVDKLSNTGRLVYHLRLADIFIVQWPALREAYPLSRLGTIL